jgi:hypothetical protein
VQLATVGEVEERLFAAAPGAAVELARLAGELPLEEDVLLDLPISAYGGG